MAAVSHTEFGLGQWWPIHEVQLVVAALSSHFGLIKFAISKIMRFLYLVILA